MLKEKLYWLSYDLGLRGHYEELYEWLDNHDAKECGSSIASFHSIDTEEKITQELRDILGEKARIYLIRRKDEGVGGKFIIGKRKKAPWIGYALSQTEQEDVEV